MKKIIGLMLAINTLSLCAMKKEPREKTENQIVLPAALETICSLGPTNKNLKVAYLLARTITSRPIDEKLLRLLVFERVTRNTITNLPHHNHLLEEPLVPLTQVSPLRATKLSQRVPNTSQLCSLYNGKTMPLEEKNWVIDRLSKIDLSTNLFDYQGQTSHLSAHDKKELREKIIPTILEKLHTFKQQLSIPIESVLISDGKDYLSLARRSYLHHPPDITGEEKFVENKTKTIDNLKTFFRYLLALPLPHMAMPYLPYGKPLGTPPPYPSSPHEESRAMRYADANVWCEENPPVLQLQKTTEEQALTTVPPSQKLPKKLCSLL